MSSAALRTKVLALSRMANDMFNLVQAAAGPYMLGSDKANLQGFTAFPALGLVTVWIVWSVLRLPDTDGFPQGIVDELFERHVPARRFQIEATRIEGLWSDSRVPPVAEVGVFGRHLSDGVASRDGVV